MLKGSHLKCRLDTAEVKFRDPGASEFNWTLRDDADSLDDAEVPLGFTCKPTPSLLIRCDGRNANEFSLGSLEESVADVEQTQANKPVFAADEEET